MALIQKIEREDAPNASFSTIAIDARFSVRNDDSGNKLLKIRSFGEPDRQIPNKVSQVLEFGPDGIAALKEILDTL